MKVEGLGLEAVVPGLVVGPFEDRVAPGLELKSKFCLYHSASFL